MDSGCKSVRVSWGVEFESLARLLMVVLILMDLGSQIGLLCVFIVVF